MRPMAQKNQHTATRLAACRVGGTKTVFFFSFLTASPLLEVSRAQGLSSEVQSENKTCPSTMQQLCLWSWIDPETSHVETISHVPWKPSLEAYGMRSPVSFKSCFIVELSRFPLPTSPAKSPIDHLISSSHTFPDFPFLGKQNQTKPLKGDIPVRDRNSLLFSCLGVSPNPVLLIVLSWDAHSFKGWKLVCCPLLKLQFSAIFQSWWGSPTHQPFSFRRCLGWAGDVLPPQTPLHAHKLLLAWLQLPAGDGHCACPDLGTVKENTGKVTFLGPQTHLVHTQPQLWRC